jgi:hypothetical protein
VTHDSHPSAHGIHLYFRSDLSIKGIPLTHEDTQLLLLSKNIPDLHKPQPSDEHFKQFAVQFLQIPESAKVPSGQVELQEIILFKFSKLKPGLQ